MPLAASASFADLTLSLYLNFLWLLSLIETVTNWIGLVIIFVYSFPVALAPPDVNEVILATLLGPGLSRDAKLVIIILVSGAGEAAGSISAFHIGRQTGESDYVEWVPERLPVDVMDRTERKTVQIAQSWGFVGFAAALYVPGFPDTFLIYAFSVLEDNYLRFTATTFVNSYDRLVVTVISIEAALALP